MNKDNCTQNEFLAWILELDDIDQIKDNLVDYMNRFRSDRRDMTGEFHSVTSISMVDIVSQLYSLVDDDELFEYDDDPLATEIAEEIFTPHIDYIADKMVSDTFMQAYWKNLDAVLEYRMGKEVEQFIAELTHRKGLKDG